MHGFHLACKMHVGIDASKLSHLFLCAKADHNVYIRHFVVLSIFGQMQAPFLHSVLRACYLELPFLKEAELW